MSQSHRKRYERLGEFLEKKAAEFGWRKEDGEGAYEFICRTHYKGGYDRAVRDLRESDDY
jgi:hypothetical protein